jgi:hypothetical protein
MYESTVGVTELRDLLSKMIREGMITREKALERLKVEDHIPLPVIEDVLSMIEMKLPDLKLKNL